MFFTWVNCTTDEYWSPSLRMLLTGTVLLPSAFALVVIGTLFNATSYILLGRATNYSSFHVILRALAVIDVNALIQSNVDMVIHFVSYFRNRPPDVYLALIYGHRVVATLQYVLNTAHGWLTVLLNLNRLLSVVWAIPWRRIDQPVRTRYAIGLVFTLALAAGYGQSTAVHANLCMHQDGMIITGSHLLPLYYTLYMILVQPGLPVGLCVAFNVVLVVYVVRRPRIHLCAASDKCAELRRLRRARQVTKTVTALTSLYVVCQLPSFVWFLSYEQESSNLGIVLVLIADMIVNIDCSMNFVVYVATNPTFKRDAMHMFGVLVRENRKSSATNIELENI